MLNLRVCKAELMLLSQGKLETGAESFSKGAHNAFLLVFHIVLGPVLCLQNKTERSLLCGRFLFLRPSYKHEQ